MDPEQFREETSVSLAHDENPVRPPDLPDERDPCLLELLPERDRLEPAIMRRDAIEAHRSEKSNTRRGVSRTRSASAVRLSRGRYSETFSLTSKSALAPRQSQSGMANRQKTAKTTAARAMA